jgi:hypothetical protein
METTVTLAMEALSSISNISVFETKGHFTPSGSQYPYVLHITKVILSSVTRDPNHLQEFFIHFPGMKELSLKTDDKLLAPIILHQLYLPKLLILMLDGAQISGQSLERFIDLHEGTQVHVHNVTLTGASWEALRATLPDSRLIMGPGSL